MIRKIIILVIMLFFVACRNTDRKYQKELSKGIAKEEAEAFMKDGESIYIKINNKSKSYLFEAKLQDEMSNEFNYGASYLEKIETTPELKDKIEIASEEKWNEVQLKVFEGSIPKEKNKGVLFLIYFYEIVAYRNEKDEIVFNSLESLPKEVEVVEKYDTEKFMNYTLKILNEMTTSDENNIVFLTSEIEKEQMPFVYYDKKNNKLISIYNSYKGAENHQSISYLIVRNAFGLINNPVTVIGRLMFYIYNSGYVMTTQGIDLPENELPPLNNSGETMDLEKLLLKVKKIADKKIYRGNMEFLIDGEDFFLDFVKSIKEAKESINIRTYIFDNDDYAVKIADLLKERSKEVKTRVLMDEIGSMTAAITNPSTPMPFDFVPPRRIDQYLEKNSRINSRTAKNPWFTTDHNKVMIFDKKMAYMGGMNIGKEYRYEWHDMMLKVDGPVVGVLTQNFYEAWAHASLGGDLAYAWALLFQDDKNGMEDKPEYIDILPIYTKTGKTEILNVTIAAIKASKKSIMIENAYFSDDMIIQELINARQRGVDVKVILPYWGNHNIMNTSNMVTANNLIKSGIKVYLYPKMNHVKASIFDGFAMAGTANYDKFSMRVNQEINFCFWDENTVEKLKKELFEKDLVESMEVTGEFPIIWVDYLLEKVANQL